MQRDGAVVGVIQLTAGKKNDIMEPVCGRRGVAIEAPSERSRPRIRPCQRRITKESNGDDHETLSSPCPIFTFCIFKFRVGREVKGKKKLKKLKDKVEVVVTIQSV
jgi:hypothetical protein